MLYFLSDLWNRENLVFPTFSDSLFAENHSLTLINLLLTVLNNVFMLMCSKKSIVCENYWNKHIREIVYIQQK